MFLRKINSNPAKLNPILNVQNRNEFAPVQQASNYIPDITEILMQNDHAKRLTKHQDKLIHRLHTPYSHWPAGKASNGVPGLAVAARTFAHPRSLIV